MIFWIVIGVAFYNLARTYGKNKWAYLGIGIGLTLATQFIVGALYGLILRPTEAELKDNSLLVNLLALVISGIITFIVYRVLKNKAEKEQNAMEESIYSFGAEVAQDHTTHKDTPEPGNS